MDVEEHDRAWNGLVNKISCKYFRNSNGSHAAALRSDVKTYTSLMLLELRDLKE